MRLKYPIFNIAGDKPAGKPWFEFRNVANAAEPVEILIYEQIGKDWWTGDGVAAKDFVEQLKEIPKDREIRLLINSPGGDVADGLAIYNVLKLRRDKITARIDGLAASTASWLPLAARSVEMPENALFMIHEPWSMAMGDAEEMRKAADVLEKHGDVIANIYQEKTGKSKKAIKDAMAEETWFTGKEAKDFGFIDVLTPAQTSKNSISKHDLSRFRRVPRALTETNKQTAAPDASGQPSNYMKREKIIALLNKHGATVEDTATDEQLEAQLETILNAKRQEPDGDTITGAAGMKDLQTEIENLKKQNAAERKTRIENVLDTWVTECRIAANQKDSWLENALKDESVLTKLRPEPVIPGPTDGGPITIVSDSVPDLAKGITTAKGAEKSALIRKHENKILEFFNTGRRISNTNTIDSTLKQDVLLDIMLRAFSTQILPLTAFSTKFEANPLQGTDTVQVPFLDLETATSTDYDPDDGYVTGDTTLDNRPVVIDKRKYQGLSYTSSELRRQPFLKIAELSALKAEKLGVDVVNDVLSIITAANFGSASFTGAASTFDSDDVADLRKIAQQADWPAAARSMFLDSAYIAYLNKDGDVKTALNLGSDQVIREGKVGRLFGFDIYENSHIPGNSENLVGFMGFKSAILFASAPIQPTEDVRQQLSQYQTAVDPMSSITLEFRQWGDPNFDTTKRVIECNYGKGVGNGGSSGALRRFVSA